MVMKNPMQLTMVSAVPFNSRGAFCATRVEKRGESAMTTIPQKRRNGINIIRVSIENTSGEIRQQQHDNKSARDAICLKPDFMRRYCLSK